MGRLRSLLLVGLCLATAQGVLQEEDNVLIIQNEEDFVEAVGMQPVRAAPNLCE